MGKSRTHFVVHPPTLVYPMLAFRSSRQVNNKTYPAYALQGAEPVRASERKQVYKDLSCVHRWQKVCDLRDRLQQLAWFQFVLATTKPRADATFCCCNTVAGVTLVDLRRTKRSSGYQSRCGVLNHRFQAAGSGPHQRSCGGSKRNPWCDYL